MSSVTGALSKLNVNPAPLSQMSGYIGNYLGGSGANNAASMLAGVLR